MALLSSGISQNVLHWPRMHQIKPYIKTICFAASIFVLDAVILNQGLLNPIGIQLVWQSALPATAGAKSGLLWLRYYIPKGTLPERRPDGIDRSYVWITVAVDLSLIFVFVLVRGIVLHR